MLVIVNLIRQNSQLSIIKHNMRNNFRLFNINSIHHNLNINASLKMMHGIYQHYSFLVISPLDIFRFLTGNSFILNFPFSFNLIRYVPEKHSIRVQHKQASSYSHNAKLSEFMFLKLQWLAPLYWIKKQVVIQSAPIQVSVAPLASLSGLIDF